MRMFEFLAMAPQTPPGTEPNPKGQLIQTVMMFAVLGFMFYFLLIRPQQKQRKAQEALLKNIKSGDHVVMTNGILGIVANVKEKTYVVKIAENVKIEVLKSAVASVVPKESDTVAAS